MPVMSAGEQSTSGNEPTGPDGALPDVTVLVFSDDLAVRERIRFAVGRRPARELGMIRYIDAATERAVVERVDAGGIDLCILDGEAWPAGGMGVSRSLKNEVSPCPPIVVVMGREADRWLAAWSQADATLIHPIDAVRAGKVVAEVLRNAAGHLPVPR